jgi:hypothetical protein
MKTLLPESEIQAHLHMGTQSFGAAPEVCQERIKVSEFTSFVVLESS